ncbi:MAG TPA: 1-deoxy-D-xylulose-5-phosphate reductoisomerase [Spirochaetota bacterium]|nr:1-deoxy-D-xylulose-5-phosphate reductoisomerase [Spirochaetota bacterium]HPC43337.1 1-deoxy-D-xylulose-5-phosphate reductoisomerase [Spirochaetota bacterium]HPL17505.1 1-deoxy-D-xylulose-5-phosphate reductoisomerase [Spirochaetota bacterium]HQF06942.1 1-deoxy-D-xylulose-5-phosphate reductoisomerase [Spirochaetota bacterium]HQH95679.1 1-deoxy-D-xylulose-5-phosphate reductoisomerase [Spirochaetota bacterium]
MGRTISILGSTGSIGESTLRVVRFLSKEFSVYGLACGGNIDLLERQIREFGPAVVSVGSPDAAASAEYRELVKKFPGVEFLEGEEGTIELAGRSVDVLVSAIVGAAGLKPTLASLGKAKRLALANKETLVMAGDIVKRGLAASGGEMIPVDSEHSAVFCLTGGLAPAEIERVILTASGGSLRGVPVEELERVTPQQALAHPTWDMGNKITIDSATLMNKGLEVIEAHHLFDLPYEKIDVLVHPESVVHSMVETVDGALYAHMGVTDMVFPVLNALTWPERRGNPFGRLRLEEVGRLTFAACDRKRYPALSLCYEAGRRGGTMPSILNAANEVAVAAFLAGRIPFTDIVKIVEKTMGTQNVLDNPGLGEIVDADRAARDTASGFIGGTM